MLGGEYRHILLLGAVEALPLVQHAFPQAEVRFFERKAPLDWLGKRGIAGLSPGTVVVAFSRRAVIGLAGELNQLHPGRVAVLYGAMPLASRREEIDRFISGARRGLRVDRRARPRRQPAVRDAALRRDREVRREGAARPRAVGDRADRRAAPGASASTSAATSACSPACRGRIPIRSSCGTRSTPHVELPGRPPRLPRRRHRPPPAAALRPQRDARRRARAGAPRVAQRGAALLERRGLAPGRVDPAAARAARRGARRAAPRAAQARARRRVEAHAGADRRGRRCRSSARSPPRSPATSRSARSSAGSSTRSGSTRPGLGEAEAAAREASILRWFALQYPGVGGVTIEKAAALEEAAAARVVAELRAEIEDPTIGRCSVCGSRTAPWATLCDRCFMARGYRRRVGLRVSRPSKGGS